jgi:hypothetical protein
VFERFWQAGTESPDGLGLGLYICKTIVDAHGGRIGVESDRGNGATFRFTLPAWQPPSDAGVDAVDHSRAEQRSMETIVENRGRLIALSAIVVCRGAVGIPDGSRFRFPHPA